MQKDGGSRPECFLHSTSEGKKMKPGLTVTQELAALPERYGLRWKLSEVIEAGAQMDKHEMVAKPRKLLE